MISVDTIAKVRRANFVDMKKFKAIARELRLSRNTARSIVRAEQEMERREQPMPQLGPYVAALEAMLTANAKRSKRERLNYQRMFDELRLEGYQGGYDNVRRYARVSAPRPSAAKSEWLRSLCSASPFLTTKLMSIPGNKTERGNKRSHLDPRTASTTGCRHAPFACDKSTLA
ncbi:MAG: hypothetical protein ABL908_15670 [Hyphomicrobium sp.]